MANYKLKQSFGSVQAGTDLRYEASSKRYYLTQDVFFLENEVHSDTALFEKVLPKFSGTVGTAPSACDASSLSIGSDCKVYDIYSGEWITDKFGFDTGALAAWKAGFILPLDANATALSARKKKLDEMFKRSEHV